MVVRDVHERALSASPAEVGALIDSLASAHDRLWPRESWPRMRLDRPLEVGAVGGQGPIGYRVESYVPGQTVVFRLSRPKGFDGIHRLDVVEQPDGSSLLRHVLEMTPRGRARIVWPLAIRPLHCALVEDALAKAEAEVGQPPRIVPWSRRVRALRFVLGRGRSRRQSVPVVAPGGSPACR